MYHASPTPTLTRVDDDDNGKNPGACYNYGNLLHYAQDYCTFLSNTISRINITLHYHPLL